MTTRTGFHASPLAKSRLVMLLALALVASVAAPLGTTAQGLDLYEAEEFTYAIEYDPTTWELDQTDSDRNFDIATFVAGDLGSFVTISGSLDYDERDIEDCVLDLAEGFTSSDGFENFEEYPASDRDADDLEGFVAGTYVALSAELVTRDGTVDIAYFASCALLEDDVVIALSQIAPLELVDDAWEARQTLMEGFYRTDDGPSARDEDEEDERSTRGNDDDDRPSDEEDDEPALGGDDERRSNDEDDDPSPRGGEDDEDTSDRRPSGGDVVDSENGVFSVGYDDSYWTVNDVGYDRMDGGDYIVFGSDAGIARIAEYTGPNSDDIVDCVVEYADRYLANDAAVVFAEAVPLDDAGNEVLIDETGAVALVAFAVLYEDARGTFEYVYTMACAQAGPDTMLTLVHVITIDDYEAENPYVVELLEGVQ